MKRKKLAWALGVSAFLLVSFSMTQGYSLPKPEESKKTLALEEKEQPNTAITRTHIVSERKVASIEQRKTPSPAARPQHEFMRPPHRIRYELVGDACTAPDLGKVEDGTHFKAEDFFDLNINNIGLPYSFKRELESRLKLVFQLYGSLIGKDNLRKVSLNLTFYKHREQYENFVSKLDSRLTWSQGIYSHKTISATIHYINDKQALKTSIHESIHAINHALMGATSRWLNEGLAEYFEMITGASGTPEVSYHDTWINAGSEFRYESYDFWELANSGSTWYEGTEQERYALYGNSWYWIFYLMSSQRGINALAGLMREELKYPCEVMSAGESYEYLDMVAPSFEADFREWEKEAPEHQKFRVSL